VASAVLAENATVSLARLLCLSSDLVLSGTQRRSHIFQHSYLLSRSSPFRELIHQRRSFLCFPSLDAAATQMCAQSLVALDEYCVKEAETDYRLLAIVPTSVSVAGKLRGGRVLGRFSSGLLPLVSVADGSPIVHAESHAVVLISSPFADARDPFDESKLLELLRGLNVSISFVPRPFRTDLSMSRVWHQGLVLPPDRVRDGLSHAWCDPANRALSWKPFLHYLADRVHRRADVQKVDSFDRWLAFIGGKPEGWSQALAQFGFSSKLFGAVSSRVQTVLLNGACSLWQRRAKMIQRKLAAEKKLIMH
jgi:hypothetical protein